jgi:hypothetical protein
VTLIEFRDVPAGHFGDADRIPARKSLTFRDGLHFLRWNSISVTELFELQPASSISVTGGLYLSRRLL